MKKRIHLIPSFKAHGAELFLLRMLKFCANQNDLLVEQEVWLLDDSNFPTISGVSVRRFKGLRSMPKLLNAFSSLSNDDIVYSWMYISMFITTFTRTKASRVGLIRHTPGPLTLDGYSWKTLLSIKWLCSRLSSFDLLIYNSHNSLQRHKEIGWLKSKSIVIWNGYNFDLHTKVKENGYVIGIAGRNHEMKNIQGGILTFQKLLIEIPDARLLIVGRNTQTLDLLGLDSQIDVLDEISDMNKNFYSKINLMWLPSLWGEGFPNVVVESLENGVPVVANPVGDTPHMLKNEDVIKFEHTSDWIERSKTLLMNKSERIESINWYTLHLRPLISMNVIVEKFEQAEKNFCTR